MVRWVLALLMLCVGPVGCEIPAQTFWSPDGTKAAYVPPSAAESAAIVIDDKGGVIANLAKSPGGFAWSADSKRLYFAAMGEGGAAAPKHEVRENWVNAKLEAGQTKSININVWEDNKTTTLFTVERGQPWHMALSPDQKWLALITVEEVKEKTIARLDVICLGSRRVYPLSVNCARAMCFTGPSRLAFVEASEVTGSSQPPIGLVTEVVLEDGAERLEREMLLVVALPLTPWMQAVGEDILLTTFQFTVPGVPPRDTPEETGAHKLFRYVRSERGIKELADDVGQFFAPSPDGRLVLIEKLSNVGDADRRRSELAVVELGTGRIHTLADMMLTVADDAGKVHMGMAAFPAWRGNSEISFISPINPSKPVAEQNDRFYTNLGLYRLTPQFELEAVRTLSGQWATEIKPSIRKQER